MEQRLNKSTRIRRSRCWSATVSSSVSQGRPICDRKNKGAPNKVAAPPLSQRGEPAVPFVGAAAPAVLVDVGEGDGSGCWAFGTDWKRVGGDGSLAQQLDEPGDGF